MQRLEVSGAVRPIYVSLGVKRLNFNVHEEIPKVSEHYQPRNIINVNAQLHYKAMEVQQESKTTQLTIQYTCRTKGR